MPYSKKMKLCQQACEEGHRVGWDEARSLKMESNSRYRKYYKSNHVACSYLTSQASQPSRNISAMRLAACKGQHDLAHSSWVPSFNPRIHPSHPLQTPLAVKRKCFENVQMDVVHRSWIWFFGHSAASRIREIENRLNQESDPRLFYYLFIFL
jgi:hypothetical protein